MNVTLNHHPIWDEFDKIFTQIDAKALAMEHLASCNYKVNGYWDGDELYEEITFVTPLRVELANRSLGQTQIDHHTYRWVRLQFLLKLDTPVSENEQTSNHEEIGELTLVFDSAWRIIDENWLIHVESPFVLAKKVQGHY